MESQNKKFPFYSHHCLTGRVLASGELDPFARTPYQRGYFLVKWRCHYEPTLLDVEIFKESGEFCRAMDEFRQGVEDAKKTLYQAYLKGK